MTTAKLQALVSEAVALDREIAAKTEELKELKEQLVEVADADPADRVPTDGGGWSREFDGADGCVARVTRPGPKLKAKVDAESANWAKVETICGEQLHLLFTGVTHYAPVPDFRAIAAKHLSSRDESKLLKLMTVNSGASVSFETKEGN